MSRTDSISEGSFKDYNACKPSVTSLKKQCLNSLRFPTASSHEPKPTTHLLACMSEFIVQEPEAKAEEVDDFCCFDRMKKIIEKRKNFDGRPKSKNKREEEQNENEKLIKFIQIEAKMKKMEQNLMKYSAGGTRKEDIDDFANKKSPLYDSSLPTMFLTAPVEQKWSDAVVTKNGNNKEKNQGLPGRFEMKKKLREQGYKQYQEWQKKKIIDSQNDVREFVEMEIEEKVNSMLEERDIKYNELLKNQKNLQRSILEKNLQIQNLKAKQMALNKNLQQLEAFKDRFSEQNTIKTKQRQAFLQNFHKQFQQTFPNESVRSLKEYIETLIEKCLRKFNEIECKKFDKWNEQKSQMNEKIGKLQSTIYKFKTTQNELLNNLKQFRYEQNSATMEMDCLIKKEAELERLQKKILELYNNWYGKVPDSSKEVMRNIGYLQGNYEYQKMLEHIVVFESKFSTDSKVNDYLIKILRGVQRIRKILFPKTVSNSDDRKEIMDPMYILDKLEKYMKSKVYQIQKKSNCAPKGARTSHVIEMEFLGVTDEDAIVETEGKEEVKKHASLNIASQHIKAVTKMANHRWMGSGKENAR